MKNFLILFIFISLVCFTKGGKFPKNFKICKRTDPNLNECFARAVEYALPNFKEPHPELGIPALNPGKIDRVTIRAGSTEGFNVVQRLSNVSVYGALETIVKKAQVTLQATYFEITVHVYTKQFRVECDYDFEGHVLSLPLVGNGKGLVVMNDLYTTISLYGDFHEKKGKNYANLNKATVELNPGKTIFKFDNLFGGNKALGNEMNRLINENWRELMEDVKGEYEDVIASFYEHIFGGVFDTVPFDKLFPL